MVTCPQGWTGESGHPYKNTNGVAQRTESAAQGHPTTPKECPIVALSVSLRGARLCPELGGKADLPVARPDFSV
jgi:hypothetical protein